MTVARDRIPLTQLEALAPLLPVLENLGFDFDNESLQLDPRCDIHGTRATSNVECSCTGTRYSALEFVAAVKDSVRAAGDRSRVRDMKHEHQQATMRLKAV